MKVLIPTSMRKFTDGKRELLVQASNVGEALRKLTEAHPELKSQLYQDEDRLVSYVNFFVNDQNIRDLDSTATPVDDRDELLLVPALAGG